MTLLKRLFGDLFKISAPSSADDEQIVREPIVYSDFFLSEYEQWLMAGLQKDLLKSLREERAIKLSNPEADSIYFDFRSDASNGFYFIAEEEWSNKDYSFLVHYFTSILNEEGYSLNNSRRDVRQQKEKLICTEDFYFKLPLASRQKNPIPQLWGNVSIQHQLIDDRSMYVKIMAHIYNDRSYEKALDFDELEEKLLAID